MAVVQDILHAKGHDVITISPEATVYAALERLAEYDIGALVVTAENGVVGIFSERDYARKIVLRGRDSRDTAVRDIMTEEVICVRPDQSVEKCMAIMTDKYVRHLPVLVDGKLAGVVSIGDVVKAIMREQQVLIDHLQDYIYS
ncbi:MAG: CBS domain-containing protein [Candidatus Thermofonsia bacterium]|nr:MAG: CBS domain-containing protein [Candidatus Thermofonsia bacterium]